jgi:hypothetical protein
MPTKQFQHRPKTRAPHGSPKYTERTGSWVSEEQIKWVKSHGGSAYIRELIDADMQKHGNR